MRGGPFSLRLYKYFIFHQTNAGPLFFHGEESVRGSLYYKTVTENVHSFRLLYPAVHSHCDPTDMCEHVANHLKFHSIKIGLQTLIPTAKLLAQFSYK